MKTKLSDFLNAASSVIKKVPYIAVTLNAELWGWLPLHTVPLILMSGLWPDLFVFPTGAHDVSTFLSQKTTSFVFSSMKYLLFMSRLAVALRDWRPFFVNLVYLSGHFSNIKENSSNLPSDSTNLAISAEFGISFTSAGRRKRTAHGSLQHS